MTTSPADRGASFRAGRDAPLLSARDLHVEFPGRRNDRPARAVDGVDLDLGAGEIVALVGESGCGKTTLARTLLGLQRPTSGTVAYRGTPLGYRSRDLKAYRREAQLVLQDPSGSLNPRHTVYDAVAEGLRIHGEVADERERVAHALSRAGLRPPERYFLRYPHELSGGQRQRVVIAGALVLPTTPVSPTPAAAPTCRCSTAAPGARRPATSPTPSPGRRRRPLGQRGLLEHQRAGVCVKRGADAERHGEGARLVAEPELAEDGHAQPTQPVERQLLDGFAVPPRAEHHPGHAVEPAGAEHRRSR